MWEPSKNISETPNITKQVFFNLDGEAEGKQKSLKDQSHTKNYRVKFFSQFELVLQIPLCLKNVFIKLRLSLLFCI